MHKSLETPRTVLRPFEASDAAAAFAWFSDAGVMRFMRHGADASISDTASRLERYRDHESRLGFSKWIILDRVTREPIGDAGFFTMPGGSRPELGYRLVRRCWGKGLATEVAGAWVGVARDWFGFTEVFAYAHPEHSASRHVMEKLGFQYLGLERVYDADEAMYRLALGPSRSE